MNGTGEGRIQGSLEWRKSSRSGPHGDCVEIALDGVLSYSHVAAKANPNGTLARIASVGRAVLAEVMSALIVN